MSRSLTPADLAITPRDRRFGRNPETVQQRWWHGNDPFATAFYNALSLTFPQGEAFFVESVKAFRDGTPDRLAHEIRAFTKQEVMHSREHVAFNRRVVDAGYDVTRIEQTVAESLELTKGRPPIANLIVTMALEHFTAIIAQQLLANRKHLAGADAESRQLWRWHAAEEIEHKGVAYDTFLHATRDWTRWRRWKVKSVVMLKVTQQFATKRIAGMLDLLAQDGITGARAIAGVLRYAFVSPGMFRRIAGAWLAWFLPGFHPWKHDDRALIGLYESDYKAAVLSHEGAAPPLAAHA
jgi:hypothetical protein